MRLFLVQGVVLKQKFTSDVISSFPNNVAQPLQVITRLMWT